MAAQRPGVRRRGCGPTLAAYLAAWAAVTLGVLVVAGLTHLAYPRWLESEPVVELPDRASLVVDIFANNLLIAVAPLLGGWLAARQLVRGRRILATLLVVWPALVVARSLATIGVFGGGDLGWFWSASRWWLLEVAALAVSVRTGVWVVSHPALREEHGPAMNRALLSVIALLALAAVVEVVTA